MHRADAINMALEIPGWMDPQELTWLFDTARSLPEGTTWLEVGVFRGRSLFVVACGLGPGRRLIGVDDFRGAWIGLKRTVDELLPARILGPKTIWLWSNVAA